MIKKLVGIIIIVVFLGIGYVSFIGSKIEYVNFEEAKNRMRKVEVKGQWLKDRSDKFDHQNNTFTFWMVDDFNNEMKVVLDGAKPNNFEVAEAIVVKGKIEDEHFRATDVLTKCPSKYEATGEELKQYGY